MFLEDRCDDTKLPSVIQGADRVEGKRLHMMQMNGSSSSRNSLRMNVGTSSEQDFGGESGTE